MIERDYNFIKNLMYNDGPTWGNMVLIEVTDRCNIDCPHCYHMPDNKTTDAPPDQIINRIKEWYFDGVGICFAGAEPSLHKNILELINKVINEFNPPYIQMLTNGIRFADKTFLNNCKEAGLRTLNIGLNHPSYLNNTTVRKKQLKAVDNALELGMLDYGYIGYTMSSITELEDILEEATSSGWHPHMFRIRYGSDIGRYPEQERMYVSDIFKLTQAWCKKTGKSFEIINDWDNNIYHVMVKIDNDLFRLIQWCDETDIDMEELRTGPYCDFIHDGITNFLHQVIRRDVLKNKKIALPDTPPTRYQILGTANNGVLDFNKLY
jgi:uncharacterized Fe-S cluster-containing radical SAM superfamily protein